MKIWLSVFLVFFLFIHIQGQDNPYGEPVMSKKELKQLAKEKKKAEKMAEEEKTKALTKQLIENQRFVLEANFISGRTGTRQPVNSLLNFIIVDSLEGTLQIGSNWGMGYNGVGGVTVEGRITKFEISERTTKRGTTYNINMYLNSVVGNYDIYFWISPGGSAEATVRGLYSGSLTYSGNIVPLDNSRIYKGRSI